MNKEISFILIVKAIFYATCRPSKFSEFQKKYTAPLDILVADDETTTIVLKAFWVAFCLVLASTVAGSILGYILKCLFGVASPALTYCLQTAGAAILLWGTLFIRGWEIQTFNGETLIEKVNQWLFRFLYCFGTAIFMSSLTWSLP